MSHENSKKILIVEDEPSLRRALEMAFRRAGFSTSEARNGEVGLVTALALEPDLIILDIVMPVMDGLTMLKKLRLEEIGKHIPVIIFTNLGEKEVHVEALALGVTESFSKTQHSLHELVGRAKEMLGVQ